LHRAQVEFRVAKYPEGQVLAHDSVITLLAFVDNKKKPSLHNVQLVALVQVKHRELHGSHVTAAER
jgi:hypothetical protein